MTLMSTFYETINLDPFFYHHPHKNVFTFSKGKSKI